MTWQKDTADVYALRGVETFIKGELKLAHNLENTSVHTFLSRKICVSITFQLLASNFQIHTGAELLVGSEGPRPAPKFSFFIRYI
jgi:hypothetical protein